MEYLKDIFSENFCNMSGLIAMTLRFLLNVVVVWFIVHFFYYPKGKRRDYYFTYLLLSVSIFMLIYLMDGSKLEIGAALGLFAVFGIIRYRTESVPIREMTYLFFLVALSVLNGTNADLSIVERLAANLLLIAIVWASENFLLESKVGCKFVRYDNIDLITPERHNELKADLEKRLGVEIVRIEVGSVDFLTDMTMLRVFYQDPARTIKSVDRMLKMPREEEGIS